MFWPYGPTAVGHFNSMPALKFWKVVLLPRGSSCRETRHSSENKSKANKIFTWPQVCPHVTTQRAASFGWSCCVTRDWSLLIYKTLSPQLEPIKRFVCMYVFNVKSRDASECLTQSEKYNVWSVFRVQSVMLHEKSGGARWQLLLPDV